MVPDPGDHELDDRSRSEADHGLGDRLDRGYPQMGEAVEQLGDCQPRGGGNDSCDRPAPVLTGQPHRPILPQRSSQPKRSEPHGATVTLSSESAPAAMMPE